MSSLTMSSIPPLIRSITTKLPQLSLFPSSSSSSSSKPLFSSFPSSLPSSFKSITFQRLPTNTKPTTKLQSLPSPSSSSPPSLQPIEELPPKLQEIIKLFQAVQDPRAKYQQLMFYANNLPPLDDKFKTNENKVQGCVSQVWVRAYLDHNTTSSNNGVVYYEADSDSIMTKGLAALLVLGLSGQPISKILKVSPDFVTLLGLQQNLTPSRNNGFLNMLKLMQRKALFLGMEADKQTGNSVNSVSGSDPVDDSETTVELNGQNGEERSKVEVGSEGNGLVSDSGRLGLGLGKRGERIREILEKELNPIELELEDISYQHAGHMGAKGIDGEETHFNLNIVSSEFEGKSLVKRHRMIYGLLQDELQNGLHALSIIAKTPSEV